MLNQRPRLLLIDDDPEFRALFLHLLQGRYLVTAACEGEEGYLKAVTNRPDAIVLDLNMPGWYGVDTLIAIRTHARLRHVPVLVLSGDSRRPNVLAALDAGADGFLIKEQFSRSEIIRRLNILMPFAEVAL